MSNIEKEETRPTTGDVGNKVFQHNGKWAYKSPIDSSLFIYNTERNEWLPESQYEKEQQQQKQQDTKTLGKRGKNEISSGNKKQGGGKSASDKLLEESTVVYVTGLPSSNKDKMTTGQLHQFFRKAGYISEDQNQRPKIIQFINEETQEPRGDAIISYERKESIPLAILQLDETEIKPGFRIQVEKATLEQSNYFKIFEQEQHSNKKSKKDRRDVNKKEKKFGWSDSESKCVIIKNLFSIEESLDDPNFFNQLQEDLEDVEHGCAKCGEISSIAIFQRNPDGVASIKFKDFEAAEKCVALMNDRYFAGRKLEADFYDGYTDYFVEETEEEAQLRLKRWEKWLEQNGEDGDNNKEKENEEED
ncbi:RNA-binding region RNP-1 domain-containing protein [Tieghemostelium lacteum]|uniref:RNA-binding region RNP-1 domain-containing protein n=1 Tax=Tieghemostelium lacteum TaxID=361077 RepID=A0A151ZGV1_TIELA|nr:RNA-binding region RNP-1 domain-containing protein [Tieghemostelium lacteum]|eukprot:KYQ93202.1 RNA-binding region RNP-1 domain-containing protein [Tieghemostelium lacteum]